jgi:hypothetical protein
LTTIRPKNKATQFKEATAVSKVDIVNKVLENSLDSLIIKPTLFTKNSVNEVLVIVYVFIFFYVIK